MVILITGGAGFVGSYLALDLKSRLPSAEVVALDNLKRRGSELNLSRLRDAGVKFVHGDVRNPADLELPRVDLMIECSAEPSALAGRDGGTDYLVQTNLLGTYHCLELARRHRAQMLFLSTSRVYPIKPIQQLPYHEAETRFELEKSFSMPGVSERGIAEEFHLEGARTLYGATKLASELLIAEYVENFDLDVVINRCGVLTGPWQMGKVDQGVVVLWVAKHFFKKSLSYIGYGGSGKQVRDLLHVHDLAELIWMQMQQITSLRGRTFNVGGGKENSVSLLELTRICEDVTGKKIEFSSDPHDRPGDVPWFITDSSKIKEVLGWRPRCDSIRIIEDVFNWIQQNEIELKRILD